MTVSLKDVVKFIRQNDRNRYLPIIISPTYTQEP